MLKKVISFCFISLFCFVVIAPITIEAYNNKTGTTVEYAQQYEENYIQSIKNNTSWPDSGDIPYAILEEYEQIKETQGEQAATEYLNKNLDVADSEPLGISKSNTFKYYYDIHSKKLYQTVEYNNKTYMAVWQNNSITYTVNW